jgi:hypothetical protein
MKALRSRKNAYKPQVLAASAVEKVAVGFCVFLTLLPLILFRYFPNQDGSAHVNEALTLAKLHAGASFVTGYFDDAGFVLTNWATTVMMSLFRYVMPPAHFEAAFVAVYAVLMMAAIIFAVRFLFRAPLGYALAFFPLIFSHMLHMGSFNLALSSVPFLVLLGLCHRYLAQPSGRLAATIAANLVLIFSLHIQMALLAFGCTGIYALWILAGVLFGKKGSSPVGSLRIADGLFLILACVPIPVLSALFFMQNHSEASYAHYIGLKMKFVHLIFLTGISSYSVFGMGVAAILFLCLAAGVFIAARRMMNPLRITRDECMLACAIAMLLIFFAMPNGIGDVFNIEERLMTPVLMALIAWLVLKLAPVISGRMLATIAVAIISLQAIDRIYAFAQINRDLKEYAEAIAAIPDRSAVIAVDLGNVLNRPLPRHFAQPLLAAPRFDPERSFIGTAIGARDIAYASNYEAQPARSYFALKQKPWLGNVLDDTVIDMVVANESEQGTLTELIGKIKTGALPISYLAIWASDPAEADDPKAKAALAAIDRNYDRVYTSPRAHVMLYRLKPVSSAG